MHVFYVHWVEVLILEVKVSLFVAKKNFSEKQMNTDQHRLLGLINNDDDHNEKQIGLQCLLVSLCLVLFHSV